MRPRTLRSAFLTASVLASLVVPTSAEAGGAVVPREGRSDPTSLDVRVAVAVGPSVTTRWNEITIPPSTHVLWLVPARPGATIGWANDGWLSALEEATAPRILRPSFATLCDFRTSAERTIPWTASATKRRPASYELHPTSDSVRAAAKANGFAITAELDERIASLYASGFQLVALDLQSGAFAASSGTLRVTDDGASVLPLALTGSRSDDTRVDVFTIGPGVATTAGAKEVDGTMLSWGAGGSSFVSWRRDAIESGAGAVWVRESSSHAALFDGTIVTGSTPAPSVVSQYLGSAPCASTARSSGASDRVVGASIPASTFACSGLDDLAIALDGLAPRSAVVTRWSGIVPRGALADDRALTFDANAFQSPPAVRAGYYERACVDTSSPGALSPGPTGGTAGGGVETSGGTDVVYVSDGCGGGTATTTTIGDDTTTTSSSDDGWDTSDSDACSSDSSSSSSSSDSCGSDSSSTSSDSCSSDSSSGDSDDGWDTEDGMTAKAKKHSVRVSPKRSRSPFSRYAVFAVALILPLRRRARRALDG